MFTRNLPYSGLYCMVTLNFHFELGVCRKWCSFVRLHTKAPFYCCVLEADLLQHSCICICTTRHHVLDLNEFHTLVKRKICCFLVPKHGIANMHSPKTATYTLNWEGPSPGFEDGTSFNDFTDSIT